MSDEGPSPDGAASGEDPTGGETRQSAVDHLQRPVGVEQLRLYVAVYALVGVGAGVVGAVVVGMAGDVLPRPEAIGEGSIQVFRAFFESAAALAVAAGVNLLAVTMAAVFGLRIEAELLETDLRGVYAIAAAANGVGAFVMGAVGGLFVLGGAITAALVGALTAGVVGAGVAAGAVWLSASEFVRGVRERPSGPESPTPSTDGGSVDADDPGE